MQLEDFTEGWSWIHIGFEGDAVSINGIKPWNHTGEWKKIQAKHIIVPHPSYPQQRHGAFIYEITLNGKATRFAAAELSNGVWGFYIPR